MKVFIVYKHQTVSSQSSFAGINNPNGEDMAKNPFYCLCMSLSYTCT